MAWCGMVSVGCTGMVCRYYAKPGRDPAFLGKLTNDDIAATVASAVGPSGPNVDYVLNLDRWCRQNGVDDDHVSEVARLTRERMA